MTAILAFKNRGSGNQQLTRVNTGGGVAQSLGGPVRDANATLIDDNSRYWNIGHRSIQINDKVFVVYRNASGRVAVSEFVPDAQALILSGDPTGGGTPIPLQGETVTQAVSGATGVLVEDYIAGDNYIHVKNVSGTFDAVNSCTFSTATSSTTPTSVEINGGECFRRFQGAVTLKSTESFTGAHHYVSPNNKVNFAFLYIHSSNSMRGVVYDSDNDTFSESANLLTEDSSFVAASIGFKNTIYFKHTTGSVYYLSVYNPATESVTNVAMPGNPGTSTPTQQIQQANLAVIKDRVFTVGYTDAGGTGTYDLLEVTGGTPTVLFTTSSAADFNSFRFAWTWQGRDDNAIYLQLQSAFTVQKLVYRFYIDDAGVVQKNMEFVLAPTTTFADLIFPPALETATSNAAGYFFRTNEDNQLNPDFICHAGSTGGAVSEYNMETWANLDSGLVATFNGTLGQVDDVVFQNAPALSVGEVIRNNTTNRAYKVAAVSGVNVQLTSFMDAGGDATSTDSAVSVMSPWIFQASTTGSAGLAFPSNNSGGGGYTYTPGEHTFKLVSRLGTPGKEKFTFTLHSDSGTLGVKVSFFYRLIDGVDRQATVSDNVGAGTSIVSNEMLGCIADNGATVYELSWNQSTDSVESGASVEWTPSVEVE